MPLEEQTDLDILTMRSIVQLGGAMAGSADEGLESWAASWPSSEPRVVFGTLAARSRILVGGLTEWEDGCSTKLSRVYDLESGVERLRRPVLEYVGTFDTRRESRPLETNPRESRERNAQRCTSCGGRSRRKAQTAEVRERHRPRHRLLLRRRTHRAAPPRGHHRASQGSAHVCAQGRQAQDEQTEIGHRADYLGGSERLC